ncbi:MAG: B12-binding domain-containing radical SAM protein [Candidatus Sericytochromatia bacterium]|nr:B12-binding domain-containing radical SAM protein [Candidatus Sericytochromatia bacterium]
MLPPMGQLTASLIIRLMQVNQPHMGQIYLPYAAGLLESYVRGHAQNPSRYTFLPPLFRRMALEQAVQAFRLVDVAGFSLYTWNSRFSLAVAQELKRRQPQTLIVVGGPEVPERSEAFLRAQPWVDLCVHAEGERSFLALLEALPGGDWAGIAGISYLKAGAYFRQANTPRINPLEDIPSPYLSGAFDLLMKTHPSEDWIALWETNRGCPFSCSFCDWGSATRSKVLGFGDARLEAEIGWFVKHRIKVVFSCDANFGILKRDQQITEAMVQAHQKHGFPQTFVIQNTKNVTDRAYQIQKRLCESGLNQSATLSLQSLNPEVLKAIRRENISLQSYRELQIRFRRDGVPTYTDMIVGLPGESYDSFADGIAQVISEGQHHHIRYFNCYVLPNAELGDPAYQAEYGVEFVSIPYVFSNDAVSESRDGLGEQQQMVVACKSYSREDWVKMKTYAWFSELLHFNRKLLQLPLMLLNLELGLSFRTLFEAYMRPQPTQAWMLEDIWRFFLRKARAASLGETPFCLGPLVSNSPLQVWLEAHDYVMMGILQSQSLDAFYQQNQVVLENLLQEQGLSLPAGLLQDSLSLSRSLFLGQAHGQPWELRLGWNLWEFYQGLLSDQPVPLRPGAVVYCKDWAGPPYDQLQEKSNHKKIKNFINLYN